MIPSKPHYTVALEAGQPSDPTAWRFVVCRPDGEVHLEANDQEPGVQGERLELLTVVRALESLDEPASVTLLSASRYVRSGIQFGIAEWAENGWLWESFGQMVPVANADLWQRLARALKFHDVTCRTWRLDPAHPAVPEPATVRREEAGVRAGAADWVKYAASLLPRVDAWRSPVGVAAQQA